MISVRLSDLVAIEMGLSPNGSTYNNEGVGMPLLNGPTDFGPTHPDCTLYTTDPKRVCQKGDLIFCVRGSTTGRMNWADKPYALGRGVCSMRGFDLSSTRFARYAVQYNLDKLLAITGGGTFPNLRKSDITDFEFLVPVQYKKVGDMLSQYDYLIENNLRRIKLLEEMAQRTYEEWFVRFKFPGHENVTIDEGTGLPEGWSKQRLDEVAEINSKSVKKGYTESIKYIDIASVSPGSIGDLTEYDFADAPGRARRLVRSGDILWSTVRPNRRSYAVVWNPEKGTIASTGFCVISPSTLPTSYLYQFVTTPSFVGYLTNMAGGVAYPAVKPVHFQEAEVVVPDDATLLKFDAVHGNSLRLAWNLGRQNQLAKEARDILLPRLMTGVIDVDSLKPTLLIQQG